MNGFIFLTNVKVNVLVSSFCFPKDGSRTSRDGCIVLKFHCLVDNIEEKPGICFKIAVCQQQKLLFTSGLIIKHPLLLIALACYSEEDHDQLLKSLSSCLARLNKSRTNKNK